MKEKKYFHNDRLEEALQHSLPWLSKWQEFAQEVEEDTKNFVALLKHHQIPLPAWVPVGDHGSLGWGKGEKEPSFDLWFQKLNEPKPHRVLELGLEDKVLIFPYLPELSFLLCTRIKLAHTNHLVFDQYAKEELRMQAEWEEKDKKILTYA